MMLTNDTTSSETSSKSAPLHLSVWRLRFTPESQLSWWLTWRPQRLFTNPHLTYRYEDSKGQWKVGWRDGTQGQEHCHPPCQEEKQTPGNSLQKAPSCSTLKTKDETQLPKTGQITTTQGVAECNTILSNFKFGKLHQIKLSSKG